MTQTYAATAWERMFGLSAALRQCFRDGKTPDDSRRKG